jgi:hypothetical protein
MSEFDGRVLIVCNFISLPSGFLFWAFCLNQGSLFEKILIAVCF